MAPSHSPPLSRLPSAAYAVAEQQVGEGKVVPGAPRLPESVGSATSETNRHRKVTRPRLQPVAGAALSHRKSVGAT